jgi:hypothetical protein
MEKEVLNLKNILTGDDSISKTSVEILKTSNYKLFNFSTLNRVPKHYSKILESIKKNDLTKFNPILVTLLDDKMLIVDGQNRFLACKSLGKPIYFILTENVNIYDAPQLNSASKNWSVIDYVNYYAKIGNDNYRILLDISEKYDISLSTLIRIGTTKVKPINAIKDGTFTLSKTRNLYEFSQHVSDLREYISFGKKYVFIEALAVCYFNEKYDSKRMIKKMLLGSGLIHDQPTRFLMRKEIEKLYNYNSSKKNHVNFDR